MVWEMLDALTAGNYFSPWASLRPGSGGNVRHKPDFCLLGIYFSILEVIRSL